MAGQLFWQSESAVHLGMHVVPPPVLAPVLVLALALPVVPALPPPLVAPVSVPPPVSVSPPLGTPPPPLLNSGESEPLAQAAIKPPVARTRTRTLMLA